MNTGNNVDRVRLGKNHKITRFLVAAALCSMIACQTALKEMIRLATLTILMELCIFQKVSNLFL